MVQSIEINPNLSGFLSSFREIGYKLETAVADIVDNSISAGAKNVRISLLPSQNALMVFDDGCGMSPDELVEAMRLGTEKDFREAGDLGKFGLGLKTASFSQTKKFSVISKKNGVVSALQWDIDFVEQENKWLAKKMSLEDLISTISGLDQNVVKFLDYEKSWTIVLWENLDKYAEYHLEELVDTLRKHLSLVFHWYMAPEGYNKKRVALFYNGTQIIPVDPFAEGIRATQKNKEEEIIIRGHKIYVKAFDVPNHNKLTQQQYEVLAMGEGFSRNQGFYLYREGRLLSWGTWFGLAKACDATSLARVRIDVDNKQDDLWRIDVKKSMADPVPEVKEALKPYAGKTMVRSKVTKSAPHVRRGDKEDWWMEERLENGKIVFRINRQHSLYKSILESFDNIKPLLDAMFSKIEADIPIKSIDAIMNTNPHDIQVEDGFNASEMKEFALMLKGTGKTKEQIAELLTVDDPSGVHAKDIEKILQEVFE